MTFFVRVLPPLLTFVGAVACLVDLIVGVGPDWTRVISAVGLGFAGVAVWALIEISHVREHLSKQLVDLTGQAERLMDEAFLVPDSDLDTFERTVNHLRRKLEYLSINLHNYGLRRETQCADALRQELGTLRSARHGGSPTKASLHGGRHPA